MKLEINQTWGQLGLNIQPPQEKIQQKEADFKLKTIPGQLKIKSPAAKLEIDGTRVREDLGFKSSSVYSKELAQEGIKASYQAIAQYVKEGNQLSAIEKKGKPLIAQAEKRAKLSKRELSLKWKRDPEIKVTPQEAQIDFNLQELDGIQLDSKPNWPQVDLQWGKVKTYLEKEPDLEIRAIDLQA